MISRWQPAQDTEEGVNPKGFDDFDLRLGDVMRGERATMGKSLLDVQRELRIKASYIAAIENADPSAFDTPGFIAGYVRSYARYLGMDPDRAFATFCEESGFSVSHGMSSQASGLRTSGGGARKAASRSGAKSAEPRDPFTRPNTPFIPESDGLFSRVEPGAVGSLLVLMALIGGIGYGGWTVLREIQQVQLTPVDQTPEVLAALDPLDSASPGGASGEALATATDALTSPSAEALDRLYRPQALDVPVLIARDAPISTLDPSSIGTFASADRPDLPLESAADRLAMVDGQAAPGPEGTTPEVPLPQVTDALGPGVTIVAVRPAWVRVRAADGSAIYEKVMEPGDTYNVPQTEDPARITVGESGAIYFAVNGQTYGPAGSSGSVTRNLALDAVGLTESFAVADLTADTDLAKVVAELTLPAAGQ